MAGAEKVGEIGFARSLGLPFSPGRPEVTLDNVFVGLRAQYASVPLLLTCVSPPFVDTFPTLSVADRQQLNETRCTSRQVKCQML